MRGRARRTVALVLATGASVLLASCSSAAAPDGGSGAAGDELLGQDAVVAEYDAVVAELEWPEGYTPPPRREDEAGWSYQAGVGATDAVMVWNCAWGRAWLEARESDPAAAGHALTMYAAILDRPEFTQHFDPDSAQPVVRGIIEDARLGDPSGVQRDVSTNCSDRDP
ncbi:hypothetical protein GC089_03570 [Cellulomonas sp. JZ18]|uniref:hypothetical protein n=1 Tax=Cellulomonas sp. JZ18 TaxID=2654191 RepID=UPI0012D417B7|nr:hypothetical protein [Cellulomonas sp. JZ18]QGQ18500.1 hypothetical protein GC089_03570 [Cellulomonas sp. JZ18]